MRLFYGSVLAGMLLAVLAAGVIPLPKHERYRSSISVIPDGGRAENFVIEWPQDRVALEPPAGLRRAGGAVVLAEAGAVAASVEVFRLRDVAGNIIGLASRSTAWRQPAGEAGVQGTDWVLLIPSRGALFLTQTNGRDVAPRAHPERGGLLPAADVAGFWLQDRRLRITAGPEAGTAGRVSGGTAEFSGLRGDFDETWDLEETGADGSTRGRITLATRLKAQR